MSRQAERKEETRANLLAAAGRGFRKHGYAGIGVDSIARAAGATSGAFYAHLGSKDGAFLAALEAGLDEVLETLPIWRKEHGAGWIAAFTEHYFGAAHRGDLEGGCAMASLSPELATAPDAAKALYEQKMAAIAAMIAEGLAGGSQEERISRAWAFLGALTGGLTMSRAVADPRLAEAIAHVAKTSARRVAEPAAERQAEG